MKEQLWLNKMNRGMNLAWFSDGPGRSRSRTLFLPRGREGVRDRERPGPSENQARDEPNFDLFGSFGLDFFSHDEILLTETDLTEQRENIEQTEIGQINDEAIHNFITENRNRIEANCKITIFL